MVNDEKPKKSKLTKSESRALRRERNAKKGRIRSILISIGIILIAGLLVLSLFSSGLTNLFDAFSNNSSGDQPGLYIESPGGYKSLVTPHLTSIDESHPPYNSTPATSGWHYYQWARWGVHEKEVPDEILVHNLEHAGVRIHYNCPDGCEDLIKQLISAATDKRSGVLFEKIIIAPYTAMDRKIALVAWNYLDQFDLFDEDRIRKFLQAHVNSPNAPEPRGM